MPSDQHGNPAEEPTPSRPEGPQVTRIGRRPDNDIVVSDLGVSKQQAELRALAARNPAVLPVLDQFGIKLDPEA
jgi:pSer/pThr/pTyr-binding forkhead associated (FHA) protein